MSSYNQQLESQRLNILILGKYGGGVRGLSSLLILRELMKRINYYISCSASPGEIQEDLKPRDIFKFVAGTSTGGLIAIMLGKLGMTVDECIKTYHIISTTIFKKKKFRGRLTHGLMRSKYSGKQFRQCISDLLEEKGFSKDLKMTCDGNQDHIACAVVCRELESPSKYSKFKSGPVCICNLPCNTQFPHPVCDAARATSAAPTFFPVVQIDGRCFVDGGMEYNNPSSAIEYHYAQEVRVQNSKSRGAPAHHGDLKFNLARYVNIGTGTKTDDVPERHRDAFAKLMPSFIRMGVFLKETLTQVATNSEHTAQIMKSYERVSHKEIVFERFSAGHGVCFIKMDSYSEMEKIETLTQKYLDEDKTKNMMNRVAEEIISDYLDGPRRKATKEQVSKAASPQIASSAIISSTTSALDRLDQPAQSSDLAEIDQPTNSRSIAGVDAAQLLHQSTKNPSLRQEPVTPATTHSSNGCSSKSADRILTTSTSTAGEHTTPLTPPDQDERKCSVQNPISDGPPPVFPTLVRAK